MVKFIEMIILTYQTKMVFRNEILEFSKMIFVKLSLLKKTYIYKIITTLYTKRVFESLLSKWGHLWSLLSILDVYKTPHVIWYLFVVNMIPDQLNIFFLQLMDNIL